MRRLTVLVACLAGPVCADDFVSFQSPSGNIHCLAMTGTWNGVRCDISDLTMSFPVAPDWCEFDWGISFEVETDGVAQPACVSDTVMNPDAPVLAYGQSVSVGGITCTSAETGMTCQNGQGHGFTIRRAQQQVW